jgi:murein DD-endopeptidase MepM/ murein hydrolase activator NlpD
MVVLPLLLALASAWLAPVEGPVVRPFAAPESPYGAGHRGVDFAAPPGTAVRAAAAGTVTFAGPVGGAGHVAVAHAGRVITSYSYLSATGVRRGQAVRAGDTVGRTGGRGPGHGAGVVHFGVRTSAGYVDPMAYLATPPAGIRLAPVVGRVPERGGYTCGTRPHGREFTRPRFHR